jgi:hypothetical protein
MKSAYLVLIFALSIGGVPGLPQDKPDPFRGVQSDLKFIELKHLMSDHQRLERVIQVVRKLDNSPTQIVYDSQLKTLALKGSPQDIARIEELLRRFDIPERETRARQIQLTIHMVEATEQPAAQPSTLPSNLTSAIEQIRTAFGYKGFRLIDTIMLQGRGGSGTELTGLLPITATREGEKTFFSARYAGVGYVESQKTLFVTGFRFNIRIPVTSGENVTYGDSGISTDLSIRDDQKLVLGKLSKDQMPGSGVFLILTSKVD